MLENSSWFALHVEDEILFMDVLVILLSDVFMFVNLVSQTVIVAISFCLFVFAYMFLWFNLLGLWTIRAVWHAVFD